MRAHRLAFSLAAAGAVTAAVTVPTVLATSAGRARPHLAATLYVSAAGSDAGRCTQRAPCASFGRAYAVASPGDTVLVGSGTYGDQTIGYDSSKSGDGCDAYDLPADVSGCVTFQAGPGATVSFAGEITIVGNGVRLVGFDLGANGVGINPGSVCHSPPTRGVVLDGLRSNGGKLAIDGASYVADVNGNWGNGDGESVIAHSCDSTGEGDWLEPTHLRFDHSWYHDVVQHTVGTSEHIECMHLDAADYVTIESSRFTNCAGYDLRIAYEHRSVESVSHYLIENSVFAATCSEQQVGVNCFPIAELELDCSGLAGTSCDSDVVRFNTIDGRFHPSVEEGSSGFTSSAFYGNVTTGGEDAYHCKTYLQTGMAYYDDVFGSVGEQGNPGVPCGRGSVLADRQLVAPGPPAYDFRLAARSVRAANRVPPSVSGGYPATDRLGRARPQRSAVDAGAHQWETAAIVLGRSIGEVRIGEPEASVSSFYGRPGRRSKTAVGTARLDTLVYHLRGGDLTIYADRGVVVGVATSSPYYSTPSGLGVGTDAAVPRAWRGVRWLECRRTLARAFGRVGVYVAPRGGKAGSRIARITFLRRSYPYDTCTPAR